MAKTKAEIMGLEKVEKDVKLFVKNIIKDKELLEILGNETVNQIKKQTQAGLEDYKQPKLQDSTVEARKILMEVNGHSGFAKPARSNLTLTGQLLESLSFRINQAAAGVTVFLKDFRYETLPLSKAERDVKYHTIVDKDHNATNKKRSDPKDAARLKGIFLASKKPDKKTNKEIMLDLERRGFRFFFISKRVEALLQAKVKAYLRQKLSNYQKLKRSLK